MPFDSFVSPSDADLFPTMRSRVRTALAGWEPRPVDPAGRGPLAVLRTALYLLGRPLSDRRLV